MKSQKHNQGELTEITVKIEAEIADILEEMSRNSGLPQDDIVVIALKRYKAAHSDYIKKTPDYL